MHQLLSRLVKTNKTYLTSFYNIYEIHSPAVIDCRNTRSASCPFCRGSLKRVKSRDLWVLTCNDDVIEPEAVSKEDLLSFYLYIDSLPKDFPDALFMMYYEYLI